MSAPDPRPAPLTPPDCDVRGATFSLDVARLRDSQLAAEVSGEGFRAAVLLWCAAWEQVPAASLPADDRALAAAAGFGRLPQLWAQIRAEALRGFVLCADGRLYHRVVAEYALQVFAKRRKQAANSAARWAGHTAKRPGRLAPKKRRAVAAAEPITSPAADGSAVQMAIPRDANGDPMGCDWRSHGIPSATPVESHGMALAIPRDGFGDPMGSPVESHGMTNGIPWDANGDPMGFHIDAQAVDFARPSRARVRDRIEGIDREGESNLSLSRARKRKRAEREPLDGATGSPPPPDRPALPVIVEADPGDHLTGEILPAAARLDPIARASVLQWQARLDQALTLIGDAADRVSPGLASWAPLKALCEPATGPPCDWEADVLPAIAQAAAHTRSRGQLLRSWSYPSIRDQSVLNRDRRLAGNPEQTHGPLGSPAPRANPASGPADRLELDRRLRGGGIASAALRRLAQLATAPGVDADDPGGDPGPDWWLPPVAGGAGGS